MAPTPTSTLGSRLIRASPSVTVGFDARSGPRNRPIQGLRGLEPSAGGSLVHPMWESVELGVGRPSVFRLGSLPRIGLQRYAHPPRRARYTGVSSAPGNITKSPVQRKGEGVAGSVTSARLAEPNDSSRELDKMGPSARFVAVLERSSGQPRATLSVGRWAEWQLQAGAVVSRTRITDICSPLVRDRRSGGLAEGQTDPAAPRSLSPR